MTAPAHALESKFKRPDTAMQYDIATPGEEQQVSEEGANDGPRESWITATPRESGRFEWSEESGGVAGAARRMSEGYAERNPSPPRRMGTTTVSSGRGTPQRNARSETNNERLMKMVEELMEKITKLERAQSEGGKKEQVPPSSPLMRSTSSSIEHCPPPQHPHMASSMPRFGNNEVLGDTWRCDERGTKEAENAMPRGKRS